MTITAGATGAIPILEPDTAEEIAAALKRASDARQSIVIRGAGTKMDQGRPPQQIDAFLSTRRLNRILEHQHGDLTATIEAGATLRDVNDALARHGQCLPLDPPFADNATIGGILATNDSGPLRHRFGTPRDLVIGVQLATTDGAIAKAGGQVVKNVAGYDLSKLVCGSFGSLAAIVSATFKLTPLPAASKTVIVDAAGVEMLADLVGKVMASQLEPIAFDVTAGLAPPLPAPPGAFPKPTVDRMLLRFASLPAVVDRQIEQLLALPAVKDRPATVLEGDTERAAWERNDTRVWTSPGAIVRASWLPKDLPSALFGLELIGRAAIASGLLRIVDDTRGQAAVVEQLRVTPQLRNVVLVRGSDELKSMVDVWGIKPERARLLASLKKALDPNNTLNAGRGPL